MYKPKNTRFAANTRIYSLICVLAFISSVLAFADESVPSVGNLPTLLDLRISSKNAAERHSVDEEIRNRYGDRLAVMVTDLSGMTGYTRERGIFEMLELIRRMHLASRPLAEKVGADLVKTFSDDMMFVHASAKTLFVLAQTLIRANAAMSLEGAPIYLEIGMSYGDVLYLKGEDVWGDAVNVASKLGEDLAGPGEILINHAMWIRLQEEGADLSDCRFSRMETMCSYAHWICNVVL